MKKLCYIFLFCFLGESIVACTTFCINKNGQIVFGRNYDWITGAGIVNTEQRGLFKHSMKTSDGEGTSWVSTYGSITFNQYGKEFPTGGMNEKGLVVELMWLDETIYPANDHRPALDVLQWIQYQLDNAVTTADVIATETTLRISRNGPPLHYLVADAAGNVASIEFLHGRMIVHQHKDLPFPVLTNNTYESSLKVAKPLLEKNTETSLNDNSLDRFVKTCSMLKKFNAAEINTPVTDFAFSILDKVAQGDYTKWSIVYDISHKKIHFKTAGNKNIKTIDFSAFNFACNFPSKMFNMNQDAKGDISKAFILSDKKIKTAILQQAVKEGSSHVTITKKEEEALLGFEETVACEK